MQDALFELDRKASSVELSNAEARRIADALQGLCSALEAALPFLSSGSNGIDPDNNNSLVKDSEETTSKEVVSVSWLLNLCGTIPSELEPIQLARAIVEASSLTDEAQQQHQLYDLLGDSEQAMIVLIEVMPMLPEISRVVPLEDLLVAAVAPSRPSNSSSGEEYVDFEADRRHMLLMDAMDTAQVAASAKAEVDAINGGVTTTGGTTTTTMSTHTILRSSERQAIKFAEKAAKKAAVALQRAKDAGAILDDVNLLSIDQTSLGDGGLVNRSNQEVLSLQQSLLPEGSREYYDSRGLPKDATREVIGDMERVVIPAARLDVSKLPRRLKIDDIMDAELGKAFAGTTSLNPMQSSTFEVAFHSRDNMMVCAPVSIG